MIVFYLNSAITSVYLIIKYIAFDLIDNPDKVKNLIKQDVIKATAQTWSGAALVVGILKTSEPMRFHIKYTYMKLADKVAVYTYSESAIK